MADRGESRARPVDDLTRAGSSARAAFVAAVERGDVETVAGEGIQVLAICQSAG
jgi:hypothetical protein